MVFYAAFNSISVVSQWQLTLFMSFLGFTSTTLGLWSVLPKDTYPLQNENIIKIVRHQTACRQQINPFRNKPWFFTSP